RLGRLDEIHLVPRGEITSFRHDGNEQSTERMGLQGPSLLFAWEAIKRRETRLIHVAFLNGTFFLGTFFSP
ncbi:MAG: hypothetical protein O3A92_17090, partial [Verrucomicrobia bacterium]|nr:hypothetical protein [Verrucomicrobiota bacterium]